MTLRLVVGRSSGPSGQMMANLLREKGVTVGDAGATATVYWGYPMSGTGNNALNRREPMDKWTELSKLAIATDSDQRDRALHGRTDLAAEHFTNQPVWYARKKEHKGGTDLRVVLSPEEAQWRKAAGWDFFTAHEPVKRELRTWVFRGRHCGTYEKVMARPEEYKHLGRNHRNGFSFQRLKLEQRDFRERVVGLVDKALTALGLDFGAADIIERPDGGLRILEVNTAPGISDATRHAPNALADHIKAWYDGVCQENRATSNSVRPSSAPPRPSSSMSIAGLWR